MIILQNCQIFGIPMKEILTIVIEKALVLFFFQMVKNFQEILKIILYMDMVLGIKKMVR